MADADGISDADGPDSSARITSTEVIRVATYNIHRGRGIDGKVSLNEYLSVALSAFDKASPSRPAPAKAPVDSSKKGTER